MTDDYPLALEGCDSREELAMEILLGRKNAEITRLRAEVERLRKALAFYSCEDGCNECPESERDRVSCGWTACRTLAELKGETDA